ncbi:GAF domain-containing sensor histidine kinase [Flexithrix dorotheae]|uniref:GAF domain-containing sensor histidine kinase n=1 Tax=Flexithrix dorotheae TaxID=70993 RepID=UPI0003653089|nr:ATP-binding protein [Flexithrix dorotheae]
MNYSENFLTRVSKLGIKEANISPLSNKQVILSNQISLIFIPIMIVTVAINIGVGNVPPIISFSSLFFLSLLVLFLNKLGFSFISRVLLGVFPPILIILPIVSIGLAHAGSYFGTLFASLGLSVLPLLLFSYKTEKGILIGVLIIHFLLIVFQDYLLRLNVESSVNLSFIDQNIIYLKVPQVILWMIINLSLIFLKKVNYNIEDELESINEKLNEKNRKIQEQNEAVTVANEEISSHLEELKVQNEVILENQKKLNQYNYKLQANEGVLKKAYIQLKTNEENISRQNEELQKRQEEILRQKELIEKQDESTRYRNKKLEKFTGVLIQLTKNPYVQQGDLENAIKEIVKTIGITMDVSRVSIWTYDEKAFKIKCQKLFQKDKELFEEGIEISQTDYPQYFNALRSEIIIVANDAYNDKNTSEFASAYLPSNDIFSLLDVPFFMEGKLGGVICCEHQKHKREWTLEEQSFLKGVADILTIAFEAYRKRKAEEQIIKQTQIIEQVNSKLHQKMDETQAQNVKLEQQKKEIAAQNEEMQAQQEELYSQNEALEATLSKLKHTQTQLVQSEKMAALGQLTAGIAHEINNPVNFISAGIVGMKKSLNHIINILKEYEKIDEKNLEMQLQEIKALKEQTNLDKVVELVLKVAEDINIGAQRTAEIVRSLRTFSRLDEDTLKPINIHDGIDSTLLLLRNQYKNRININKNYGQLPFVECSPGKINQVFMNILVNAIQAIEHEGEITISTKLKDEFAVIEIKDTGKGMSEEVREHIFEPFFTTKDVGSGTGLGLPITMGIIEGHNGKILVESQLGKGTTFLVELPLRQK